MPPDSAAGPPEVLFSVIVILLGTLFLADFQVFQIIPGIKAIGCRADPLSDGMTKFQPFLHFIPPFN
jgi:hypothetical protein